MHIRSERALEQLPGLEPCEFATGFELQSSAYDPVIRPLGECVALAASAEPTQAEVVRFLADAQAEDLFADTRRHAQQLCQTTDPWQQERRDDVIASFGQTARTIAEELAIGGIRQNVVRWMAVADNESMAAFMRWNERSLRPAQQALRERVPHMEAFMLQDIQRLVAEGSVPPETVGMLLSALDQSTLHVYDSAAFPLDAAWCRYWSREIGVNELWVSGDDTDLYSYLMHEFFHQLVQELGGCGFHELFGDGVDMSWFNEAVTEQLASAAVYGDINKIGHRDRPGVPLAYANLLTLLHSVLRYGKQDIPMRDVAFAMIDPSPEKIRRQWLVRAIDASWRPYFPELEQHILKVIAKDYSGAPSPAARRSVVELWNKELSQRALNMNHLTSRQRRRPHQELIIPG